MGTNHLNNPKAFIEYSAYMDDIYNNTNDYNRNRNDMIWLQILWQIKNFKP